MLRIQKVVKKLVVKVETAPFAPAAHAPGVLSVENEECSEGAAQRRPTLTGPDGLVGQGHCGSGVHLAGLRERLQLRRRSRKAKTCLT